MIITNRSYYELIQIPNYLDRFNYLKLRGSVGKETFGFDRYLNQALYRSPEWKRFRRDMILRDNGCDLACEGYEIVGKVLLHHINPITIEDITKRSASILAPNHVICLSMNTHNAIHYGDESLLVIGPTERTPYDTCTWKRLKE